MWETINTESLERKAAYALDIIEENTGRRAPDSAMLAEKGIYVRPISERPLLA